VREKKRNKRREEAQGGEKKEMERGKKIPVKLDTETCERTTFVRPGPLILIPSTSVAVLC
jgi:hypothetical protein